MDQSTCHEKSMSTHKICMRSDLTVIDGNHRLSAAILAAKDIRSLKLEVYICDDGKEMIDGLLFFDAKLNRLSVRPVNKTLYVICIEHEGVHSVLDDKEQAERWIEVLNTGGDTYYIQELELNVVQAGKVLESVTRVEFNMVNNSRPEVKRIWYPVSLNSEIILEQSPHLRLLGSDIQFERKAFLIVRGLDYPDEVTNFKKAYKESLEEKNLMIQEIDENYYCLRYKHHGEKKA